MRELIESFLSQLAEERLAGSRQPVAQRLRDIEAKGDALVAENALTLERWDVLRAGLRSVLARHSYQEFSIGDSPT